MAVERFIDRAFLLKGTRSVATSDRTYRFTYEAIDAAGNSSTATARVVVPLPHLRAPRRTNRSDGVDRSWSFQEMVVGHFPAVGSAHELHLPSDWRKRCTRRGRSAVDAVPRSRRIAGHFDLYVRHREARQMLKPLEVAQHALVRCHVDGVGAVGIVRSRHAEPHRHIVPS